jgi:hypothetical protein
LIQLTHENGYKKYGAFKKFSVAHPTSDAKFSRIGWNLDVLLAKNNSLFNYDNCADSAGFYWVCPEITATGENGLAISDAGFTVKNTTHASRLVNGNVAPENINGLDVRLQLSVFLKYVLLDLIPDKDSELITFFWRRNSAKEPALDSKGLPVLDAHGRPKKKFYPIAHSVNALLAQQRP